MPTTPENPSRLAALALLTTAIATSGGVAQDKAPPIEPALRNRFGFLDPIIKKLGYGTNMLQPVQWVKDGRVHVLVNNPHRARLDSLRLDDRRVHSESISTDGDLHGLRAADIDGDGRLEILMINSRGRLVVKRRAGKGGDTKDARSIPEIEVGFGLIYDCLRCGDIDGDGHPDVVVVTRDGLRTISRIASNPVVSAADPLFAARIHSFHLFDANADGRLDVVICGVGNKQQIHIKLGDGRGGFGAWIILATPRLLSAFPGTGEGGASLATIHVQPRRVVEYELVTKTDALRPAQLLTALPNTTKTRAFAHGDIDNDGDLDLVVADPERARLTFLFEEDGRFRVTHAPTLAGIHSLAIGDVDGDGKSDLVIASPEEEQLSWVSGARPLDSFPSRLAALPEIDEKPGIPVAVGIVDGEVLAILRNKSQKGGLYRVRTRAPGGPARSASGTGVDPAGEPTVELLVDLGRVRRDPLRLICADLDGRFGPDVAYVLANDGLQVLFRNADGKYDKPRAASGAGFTKRMEDGALSLTGSAKERALLVVRERYARRFRFDAKGQPVILSQDSGPEGNPSMVLCTELQDGTRLFLDRKAQRLFRIAPDQPTASIDVPSIFPLYLLPHGRDALVLGKQGVLRVPFARSYELRAVRSHEPPTPKTRYYSGLAADFDGDGKRELAMADSSIHGLHLLVAKGSKLLRGLSFPVFQSTEEGTEEPRVLSAGDVNSDGLKDLLLLAHDRILIYYQER